MGNNSSSNNPNRRNPIPPPSNPNLHQQPPPYMYSSNPPPHYSAHPPPPNYSQNSINPMMGPSNFQPFYPNQQQLPNGWAPVRPNLVPMTTPIVPAPYHQNTKKVRNDVNVHKDTLRVDVDELNPDQHLVSFEFDALFDGSITIYYFFKEESEHQFIPLFPEVPMPVRIPFQKGAGQKFKQPSGTGIDLGFFELDDLSKPSPGEDVYPLVIAAEVCDDQSCGSFPNKSANLQITQAVLEKSNGGPFKVKVIRQILWVDGVRYELREIFGIGSSTSQDFDDNSPAGECVICMTDPKDTAVLPCRHMCMCSGCAKELRLQSDKCPICRQPIEELLQIKINQGDQ